MGGYQLAVSLDIFRGRYRDELRQAVARSRPAQPQQYRFRLPAVNHVFQPGHRIMVQVQSSLFPLYDRNPQTYVPNIFFAKPGDYRAGDGDDAARRRARPSAVLLPVVATR